MTPADPNKRPDKSVQSYFRKIHRDYQESVGRETIAGVHERIRSEIEPRLQGLVLDIGSGGVPDHETNASRTVISLDNVFEFLKNAKGKNVLNIVGDIRALPLKRNTMDRIIIQFVIHHLTESILEKNLRNVRNAVAESARVLKKGGQVFIVDSMVPLSLEYLQRTNYIVSYHLLKALNKPMVFFFSAKKFCRILEDHGLVPARVLSINWGTMNEASQALFPWLRFPLKYTPARCTLISAVKA